MHLTKQPKFFTTWRFLTKLKNCLLCILRSYSIWISYVLTFFPIVSMQSYEWLFVPWLIYQFLYSSLMLIGPIVIIYVGFEAVTDKKQILLALLPIAMVSCNIITSMFSSQWVCLRSFGCLIKLLWPPSNVLKRINNVCQSVSVANTWHGRRFILKDDPKDLKCFWFFWIIKGFFLQY